MAVTLALQDQWHDGKRLHVIGTVTPSATYTTTGTVINFATIGVSASRRPKFVAFTGVAGYELNYVPGTNAQDGKIIGYSTAATEIPAAAWPAGLTGVAIPFYAIFDPFI